jgi:hypothetical protein
MAKPDSCDLLLKEGKSSKSEGACEQVSLYVTTGLGSIGAVGQI